jgi:hypothetical protein
LNETIKIKRRKNFDIVSYFIRYLPWIVLVQICFSNQEIAVPRYCTKFLAKNVDMFSEKVKRIF